MVIENVSKMLPVEIFVVESVHWNFLGVRHQKFFQTSDDTEEGFMNILDTYVTHEAKHSTTWLGLDRKH